MKGGAEKKIKGGFRPSRGARVTPVTSVRVCGYVRPVIFHPGYYSHVLHFHIQNSVEKLT